MSELGSVPYISPAQVVAYVAFMEPGLKTKLGEVYGRDHRRLAAAMCVFGIYFGLEWLLSRLGDSPFMRPPIREGADEYKMVDRIMSLAEHLVNLQEVAGFQYCLEEIRTDSIESGLAKLVAAGMLRRREIPFHFVVPTGKLGQDYDAEAFIGASRVPIEMKAKIEGKEPSASSVASTLKRARGQFPKDTPNVVFLRVPGPWGETAEGVQAILEGAEQEFGNSGGIGMVVAHWERWLPNPSGGVIRRDRVLVVLSKVARVHLAALESVILQEPRSGAFPWLSFAELFPPEPIPPQGAGSLVREHSASDKAAAASGDQNGSATLPAGARLPEDAVTGSQAIGSTRARGLVQMRYAHLCQGVKETYMFATLERVMTGLVIPSTRPGQFPDPSVLVSSFVASGAPARRELLITFTDNNANIVSGTTVELDFKIREPGYPVTAHQAMQLQDIEIPGPGIYYFDFLVGQFHVGRLPVLMLADVVPRSLPAGEIQMGFRARPGLMLDWGHLLDRFEQHPDGTLTLHHVYEVWPVLTDPSKPFAMDAKLLLQFSATAQSAGVRRLRVSAREVGGERIGDISADLTLAAGMLPGRVVGWQWFDLKTLGFPHVGDYFFEIVADGFRVAEMEVFAREARLVPAEDVSSPTKQQGPS